MQIDYEPGPQPTDSLVSSPVIGFSPFKVGFLQRFLRSKLPKAASVKSAFSTSAPSKLRGLERKALLLGTDGQTTIHEIEQYLQNIILHLQIIKFSHYDVPSCCQNSIFKYGSSQRAAFEASSVYNSVCEICLFKIGICQKGKSVRREYSQSNYTIFHYYSTIINSFYCTYFVDTLC